jgi:DNA-binding NtrC family response regulator
LGVNGGVAMRAILAPGGPPINAVVLDSLMPGEPSFALARVAKMLRLPVVMISGSHECMTFAADHELQLLPKPFHAAELIQAIESAFASGEFGQRHTPLQQ